MNRYPEKYPSCNVKYGHFFFLAAFDKHGQVGCVSLN